MAEATSSKTLNLYQKLAIITGEVGSIKKSGTNKEQGYQFIEYAAVAGELRHLFAKYGVVIVPRMAQAQKQTRVEVVSKYGAKGTHALIDFTFTVVNADDPDDKFTVPWTGEALDYGDKATNKAATAALKYYQMRQFNISEKGDDPDADSPSGASDRPTKVQLDEIERLIKQLHLDGSAASKTRAKATTSTQAVKLITALKDRLAKAEEAPDVTSRPEAEEPADPPASIAGLITPQQRRRLLALFKEAKIVDRQSRLDYIAVALDREVKTVAELTKDEANVIMDALVEENQS